eukprot:gene10877-14596_t
MPLIGIPDIISPELLYALAKMGHGDKIVIADANFPSDYISSQTIIKIPPIRVHGTTAEVLAAVLKLMPLDQYERYPIVVMDRVESDKEKCLHVPAYAAIANAAGFVEGEENTTSRTSPNVEKLCYLERHSFYEFAKTSFVVIQTDDRSLYANCIVYKGVVV